LKALYGEGAEPILSGQRAVPSALISHGYPFRFVELAAALSDLLE
jgi:NAD dependent epimerase/dehydratase family enzyme